MCVARPFDRIIIKGRDFLLTHPGSFEPARNVHVAESLDIGENFSGAGSGGGT